MEVEYSKKLKLNGADSEYSNLTSHILGIVVARACDTDLKSFAVEHLFGPLGIEPGFWQQDWDGNCLGFADQDLSSTDLAKLEDRKRQPQSSG